MSDSLLNIGTPALDIFDIRPDWTTQPSMAESQGREIIQVGRGYAGYRNLTLDINYSVSDSFFNLTKQDEYDLLSFFCDKQGMLKRFWFPMDNQSFVLSSSISSGDTHFHVNDDGFADIYQGYERLYMVLKDGSRISRLISSKTSATIFNVSSAFDRNIALSEILFFGRLLLARFDQDELLLQHETDDKSSCSIKFKELAKEYGDIG
jgi:hypothetical protein